MTAERQGNLMLLSVLGFALLVSLGAMVAQGWQRTLREPGGPEATPATQRFYPHQSTNDIQECLGGQEPFEFTGTNWFTFPARWLNTNGFPDADSRLVANGDRMLGGWQSMASVQLGFRDDGVVVWRRVTKEDV